nr:hypothetical protein [Angustibacter aerolatus]
MRVTMRPAIPTVPSAGPSMTSGTAHDVPVRRDPAAPESRPVGAVSGMKEEQ